MDFVRPLDSSKASAACAGTPARPAADRERPSTTRATTLARLGLAGLALVAACGGGGGARVDRYARATNLQEKCCEHLAGDARTACLQDIVRAPSADVASAPANQATYACVQEHFVCDPATGHATAESAQSQLDCIQELPQ